MSEGFEPVKLKVSNKFKRIQALKLLCIPPLVCWTVFKICFNFTAVSVALREVCLVKIPELWHFCSNQWFLFLLANVIVLFLAFLSGSLDPSKESEDLYDEFVRRTETARKYRALRPVLEKKQSSSKKKSVELQKLKSETPQQIQPSEANSLIVIEVSSAESETFSDEELQRRSEEFIANFKGRLEKEEPSAYYQEIAKRIVRK